MLQIRKHLVGFGYSNGRQPFYVWAALVTVMDNPAVLFIFEI